MSTHYSKAQDTAELAKWAHSQASRLIKYYRNKKSIPVLVYSGFSDVAAATALAIALHHYAPAFKFRMAYVRKDGEQENSHSNNIVEHSLVDGEKYEGIFVDDFQSLGKTLTYCMEQLWLTRLGSSIKWCNKAPLCLQENCGQNTGTFASAKLYCAEDYE